MTHLQSLALRSKSLPIRLEPLTFAISKHLTFGMYRKIEHRLQTYIIKYILSQKLEKYIKLITYKINITQELLKEFDDFFWKKKELYPRYSEIMEDIEPSYNEKFRIMKTNQIKYNELIFGFKYNIGNFNPFFIMDYKFFCLNYDHLLPKYLRNLAYYSSLISPEDLEILVHTPKKKYLQEKNNTFLDFYNQELEISTNHTTSVLTVYNLYKEWCYDYNKKCFSSIELKKNLKLNNFEIKNKFLLGVKIREYEED
jgi:hypothetical protein